MKPVLYFGRNMCCYIGQRVPQKTTSYRYPVACLTLNLSQTFKVSTDEGDSWHACQSVFWKAGQLHVVDIAHEDVMVGLFMDPFYQNLQCVHDGMKPSADGLLLDFISEAEVIDLAQKMYTDRPSYEVADEALQHVLSRHAAPYMQMVDSRVRTVVDTIRSHPAQKLSVSELADSVALSKVHLMQLFKQKTGMTIGKFQLWRKVLLASHYILSGNKITDSAVRAGFSDAAHFNRAFKEMIGIPPSALFDTKHGRLEMRVDKTLFNE